VPHTFWITIALFVAVGFMLLNNFYWRNVRDEHDYRIKRARQARENGQES
jgi:hypothetical protein